KLVRITPQLMDPLSNFDMRSVVRIEFYYSNILVSWYINDFDRDRIQYDNTPTEYGSDGYYKYLKYGVTDPYPVQFEQDAVNNRKLYYEDPPGNINYIQWNWDPSISTLEDMYFKDTFNPLKSVLDSTLKIDRIELPGKPATNNYLQYGFPHSLRLDITNWHEL
nr:hypothetical protein [Pseudomonadota bacterium]